MDGWLSRFSRKWLDEVRDNREYLSMAPKHLDPAKTVVAKLGGPEVAAEVTGKHISRVYRWMAPREKGGTGGAVPQEDAEAILQFAAENSLPIVAADFFLFRMAEAQS